ncbi:MAG: nucleoside deaminase [Bdellovibrionota bacterium]|nr:MAG: nucleoside deaminase [Bdellovibrionota bacterium]
MVVDSITLTLPRWVVEFCESSGPIPSTDAARMAFVIDLARQNVERGSGGPFGAAIFNADTGALVSVGVNCVTASQCSIAHAEMFAIMLAQRAAGTYDLGAAGQPRHELYTSGQTCAMCCGAVTWAGVRRVVSAASASDIEQIVGFDEGPHAVDWQAQLSRRGIEVMEGVLRHQARTVLELYRALDGIVYNGRTAPSHSPK